MSKLEHLIKNKLTEIEKEYNIKILLAVESGSRAWGFASPDSDYDVRFIYVRPKENYLKLETMRDVIELPINDELDINGWDLQKSLRLLYKSNPTLFEWLSSPIVYTETNFAEEIRNISKDYFSKKKSIYHYLSMAESNYREYIRTDMVRTKKYFYVLRPLLACNWILDKGTHPPMLFSELVKEELPNSITNEVNKLLDIKMNSPETKEIPRIDEINEYLDNGIKNIRERVANLPNDTDNSWIQLNELFLMALK